MPQKVRTSCPKRQLVEFATEPLETERHVKGTPQPDRWKEFLAQAINQFGSGYSLNTGFPECDPNSRV